MNNKLFTKSTVGLIFIGLIINILMVYITGIFNIPLYLDSIGTILAAVLGGILPGITVGFFSNIINFIFSVSNDPLTLYYGVISVLIAITAFVISQKIKINKILNIILSIFIFAVLGGVLGSILTWMLYGFSFGENVSSELVMDIYHNFHLSGFMSQLIGDFIIDLADKTVSVVIVLIIIEIIPNENGKQALEMFKASKEGEYFTIFMDVQMPELNGYEATKAIRKLARKDAYINIVGMTADAFSDDVNKALDSGMNYHVTKPIQIKSVLKVLMEIYSKNNN